MATRAEFIKRQHDEVRETLKKLNGFQSDLAERIEKDPDNSELKEWMGEAEMGVRALEPVMDEFDRDDVDPDELIKFAQTIEDWQIKAKELGKKLG